MKKIKIGICLLAVAMVIMGQELNGVSNPSNNGFFTRALVSCQAKMAFLQAGYEYTQEEKDNASEEITLLEGQQAVIWKQYNEINARQDLSTQEKDEHVHSIALSMYRLSEDIKELQLITGDAWSDDRKRAWGFVALIAAGLVTYKLFGPSIIAIVTKNGKNTNKKNPKDSDELVKKQKEQEQQLEQQQQQQQQLLDEKSAKKEANRVAQKKADKKRVKKAKKLEDVKENLRRIEKEAQERAESLVKAKEQEKSNKRHHIINQNIIDAQKQIAEINNAISNEKAQLNGEVGNQETNNKLTQLNAELRKAESGLLAAQLNYYKERERNRREMAAQREELLKKREEEKRETQIKMIKSVGNFLAETAIYTIKMAAKFSIKAIQIGRDCFNNAKARSRLSDEDQEVIVRGLY